MVNKKGKGPKTKGSKPPVKKPQQETTKDLAQQSPQERVALVRPLWETLEQEERVKLLSIDLESVRARAKQLAESARQQAVADAPEEEPLDPALLELESSIEDVLEDGIKRLKDKGTWKLWQWPADNSAMFDAESFRQHITEKHIREELRRLLPRDEGRATEKPAEAAFRQRMLDLLAKVQQSTNANSLRPTVVGASGEDGAARPYRRRGDPGSHLRDANIELLAVLLEALAKENDHLYHSLLTPITSYVMEIFIENQRETTKLELSFEDLENLLPDDVSRIVEWLTEKVDALSTKLKPEPKDDEEEEEENMGDVDLWSLTEENNSLTVNGKWLQHLQDRLLGEDGHPRRAKAGEDPGHNGLVLEWVYGSIVSTAEKARDGAKRCLGMQPPTAADAHMVLGRALEEHMSWETRAKQCKDLLSEMLKSRLEAGELTKQGYDLRPQPKRDGVGSSEGGQASSTPLLLEDGGAASLGVGAGGESKPLPDEVILFMLRREALLTRGKLHFLVFEHLTQEKELRILKQALRQGEPEFERLKRELDEVKHQPRGMEGGYRSAAEMERHRHQLEVQTAFREQGARLQATYDKKQKAEYDMAKRETEIKQLQGWKGTVENLVEKFQELINSRNERLLAASGGVEGAALKDAHEADGDLEAASGALTPQQYIQLTKMRNHFTKDVRKQLYGDTDDRAFFDNLKTALKAIERRLDDSAVALQHLEMQLINVACDDPGAIIGAQLALPLLQDRLDQRGLEFAAQRAKLAEDEVLRMELLAVEREAAERERKKAAKAKKNEKVKSEKERLAAERQAKEEAERGARQEAERERAVRDEEARRQRAEALEAMRKAEEAVMETRRKELLSDENGYWRQRMIMEERLSDMAVGPGNGSGRNDAATAATSSPDFSEEPDRQGSSSPEDIHRSGDDGDGFVTESRRRRHKDTRDQDEEVAAPAPPAPASATAAAGSGVGGGARGHLRSGSRDRMGPREGVLQRERGENHHRDREPRRHQASSSAHRSGSREGSGRQAGPHGGAGQPAHRPPAAGAGGAGTAPASPPTPPAQPADALLPEPAASPSPMAARCDASEQPAAPAPVSPSPAAQEPDAAPGTLPSPMSSAVPEDAILFGDIAVIPFAAASPSHATPPRLAQHPRASQLQAVAQAGADGQHAAILSPGMGQQQHQQPAAGTTPAPAATSQPHPVPGPPGVAAMPPSPPHGYGQAMAPMAVMPPGQGMHPMGRIPPGTVPGPMPAMGGGPPPPPMMAHMGPGGQRPPGPAPGPPLPPLPPPPYVHINGAMPVPVPQPVGPMPMMAAAMQKQMQGQQMQGQQMQGQQMQGQQMQGPPPPPPGAMLMPMPGLPGPRPPMPGPGMPPGPPPPGMQQQRPMGPQGPMHGMPGPGPQGGMVPVPHPGQGAGQLQHGQPPGVGSRGAAGPQGQPGMMAPMQFAGPMHGGGMAMPHGQPPNGPMGHVPPGMYVFPPGAAGMVPAGLSGQLPPHPHMMHIMAGGMGMQMGGPPPLHVHPQHQHQHQHGSQGAQAVSPLSQPAPPPKSPAGSSGGAGKPGSTLNANARSFVPSGKAAPPAASGAASGQQAAAGGPGQQQQGHRPQYQRQGSGGMADGSSGPMQGPPAGQQQLGGYPRGGPAGPNGGPPGQQPGQAGGQYGNRRDRREAPRGGAGPRDGGMGGDPVGAGGRKGPGVGPAGPHGVLMPPPGDMSGGPPMPPHPHPMAMMGAPPMMVVMGPAGPMHVPAPPMPHGPVMESGESVSTHSPAGPLERQLQEASDSSTEDFGRPPAGDAAGVGAPPHQPPPPPGAGPPGPGPGYPHHMMPPPPPGMAPGHCVMLQPPVMPGPVHMPPMQLLHVPMQQMPLMPMHMHPAAGGPAPGPSDRLVQKNESAAESVRAPHLVQPATATTRMEADGEGSRGGSDSAAAASATAPNTETKEGGSASPSLPQDSTSALRGAAASEVSRGGVAGAASPPQKLVQATPPALTVRPTPDDATSAGAAQPAAGHEASPASSAGQQQQQWRASPSAGSVMGVAAPSPPGRAAPGQSGPSASPPSWSSVAARRDGSATAGTSGYSQDAFPSLVPSGGSASSASSDAQPGGASSWKARLQHNAAQSQHATTIPNGGGGGSGQRSPGAGANGPSYGSPAAVRGSSPGGGGVQLASSLSDSAIAHSSATPVPRPAGNRPSGSALLVGPPSQLVGSLSLSQPGSGAGIVYHPGVSGQPRRLQLVRGLQNLGGQHNCFLNVTIQSLWHLRSFREAVLQLNVDDVAARGAGAADLTVLRALGGVFRAMAAPQAPCWVVSPLQLREALSVLEKGQAAVRLDLSEMHDAFEVLLVLLTCMHRAEAGSGASQGQDPQLPRRIRVRDIVGAGRASSGSRAGTAGASAIAMAAAAAPQGAAPSLANGHSSHQTSPPAGAPSPSGYAAAVASGALQQQQQAGRGRGGAPVVESAVPCTAAHSLFGLEVQVPCAAEEDDSSSSGKEKERQQQQQQQQRGHRESNGGAASASANSSSATVGATSPAAAASQSAAHSHGGSARQHGPSRGADHDGAAEVEVYTKYFHLVHAQALRKAFAALDGSDSGAYFEDVLCAAEADGTGSPPLLPLANGGARRAASSAGAPASGAGLLANGHGWAPGATAAAHPLATLLRFPSVFTLALVWESPQAPLEALRGTLEALGPRVDLALLFRCTGGGPGLGDGAAPAAAGPAAQPRSALCELRSVICYFGHHYLVFALSEELGLWLLIDDSAIQLVGHWSDVIKAMCAKRLQPSLLFYEAVRQQQ